MRGDPNVEALSYKQVSRSVSEPLLLSLSLKRSERSVEAPLYMLVSRKWNHWDCVMCLGNVSQQGQTWLPL